MSGDYVNPKERERRLKGKAGRRARWLSRKWKISYKGNHYLKADGVRVTIFPNGNKWKYVVDDDFGHKRFDTIDEAKLAAFEAWWEAIHYEE